MSEGHRGGGMSRRGFLVYSAGAIGALGVGCDDDGGAESAGGAGGTGGAPMGGAGAAGGEAGPPPLADVGPMLPARIPGRTSTASREEVDLELTLLSGHLPEDLHGHLFVIAPIPYADGQTPLLNGDGMLYRVDLGGEGASVKSRLMRTPCFYADEAAAGTAHAFTNAAIARRSETLGFRNQLNTALALMGSRLLVTFDAGRPWEVDPVTLQLVGPVGALDEWRPGVPPGLLGGIFPLITATAHPVYDEATGALFSVNYGADEAGGYLDVVRWDGQGALRHWTLVDTEGASVVLSQVPHQVALTENHVVIVESAFVVEVAQIFNPEAPAQAQMPVLRVMVVPRAALTEGEAQVTCTIAETPLESAHLTVDYIERDGHIVLHAGHIPGVDPSEWIRASDTLLDGSAPRAELVGGLVSGTDLCAFGRHTLDPRTGEWGEHTLLRDDDWTWNIALFTHEGFPNQPPEGRHRDLFWVSLGLTAENVTERMRDLYAEHPHRTVPLDELPLAEGRPPALIRLNAETMEIEDAYAMPPGRVAVSPQFVPAQGASEAGQGYLVCGMVADDDATEGSSGHEYWIFDARNLAQGPLARLSHPELDFAFTLHTTWLPTLEPAPRGAHPTVRADYGPRLEGAGADVVALFEGSVFPHFD